MNFVENSTCNEGQSCVIKEELIISDESENEISHNVTKSINDAGKEIALRYENKKSASPKKRGRKSKQQSKTLENEIWNNAAKSTTDDGKEETLRSENDESVSSIKRDKRSKRQTKILESGIQDNVEKPTSDVDMEISLRFINEESVSSKKRVKRTKRQTKTLDNELWDTVAKSTSDASTKISSMSAKEGRVFYRNPNKLFKRQTKASERFIKKFVKTYCPMCEEKKLVVIRKPKCIKCKTYLRYHCEKCMRSYAQYRILLYHLREKHVDGPTYACEQCGRIFSLLKYKNRHQKVCGAPPTMSCNYCPYKSCYQSNINRHIKHKHPDK